MSAGVGAAAAAAAAAATATATANTPIRVASGSYGTVFTPAFPNEINGKKVFFPDNVTKIFFENKSLDSVMAKAPLLRTIFGENEGHRIEPYRKQYKARNLPANSLEELRENSGMPFPNNSPLHMVHMPNLGTDVAGLLINENNSLTALGNVSPFVIVEQIEKLLVQLWFSNSNGYVHGDIRTPNVMVNPKMGTMTLVDFDFLMPKKDALKKYTLGLYHQPPETLLYRKVSKFISRRGALNEEDANEVFPEEFTEEEQILEYCSRQFKDYRPFLRQVGVYSADALSEHIYLANMINLKYMIQDADEHDRSSRMLSTLDSFALANVLLSLLAALYKDCIMSAFSISDFTKREEVEGVVERFLAGLPTTTAFASMSGAEQRVHARFLFVLIKTILYPMSDYVMMDRLDIDDAQTGLERLIREYGMVLEGVASAPAAGAAGVGASAAANATANAIANATKRRYRSLPSTKRRASNLKGKHNKTRSNGRHRRSHRNGKSN